MSDNILDGGHVYSPHWESQKKRWKGQGDKCCAGVPDGGRAVTFHQCNKSIKVWRDVQVVRGGEIKNLGYCGIHDPVKVKERRVKRDEEYRAEREARAAIWNRREARRDMGNAAIDAIKKIANGHNDPRSLCQSVLDEFSIDT